MNHSKIPAILAHVGAIIVDSHVVYTSGKHGSAYVNKDALYPHTEETALVGFALAEEFAGDKVQVVVGPTIGGVILSQWTAHELTRRRKAQCGFDHNDTVLSVYAEKNEMSNTEPGTHGFVLKRGYDKLVHGKNVLVVEDVLTTGGSARKVVDRVRETGGTVVGVGVLCNRGGVTAHDLSDVPRLVALMNVQLDAWEEKDCPLCAKGVPINTDVGKGLEFLARKHRPA